MSETDWTTVKVGDHVKLTGPDWEENRYRVVRVDRIEGSRLYSDNIDIGSLTGPDRDPYWDGTYGIEIVRNALGDRFYVSKLKDSQAWGVFDTGRPRRYISSLNENVAKLIKGHLDEKRYAPDEYTWKIGDPVAPTAPAPKDTSALSERIGEIEDAVNRLVAVGFTREAAARIVALSVEGGKL